MIYTLTLNPSLDHIIKMDSLKIGETNRSCEEAFYPGGKGINVSRVLTELGIMNKAYGFIAGFVGEEIKKILENSGVDTEFIKLSSGINRINLKLKADKETEINGQGPEIKAEDKVKLLEKLYDVGEGDYLVLAGSIPSSLKKEFYRDIMEMLKDSKAKIIVDATGDSLMNTLEFKPLLVKPNRRELEEIAGQELKSDDEVIAQAKKLLDKGAENVIVSLGKDGAVLVNRNNVIKMKAPEGKLINSVGSGDSMVAGFIAGKIKNLSDEDVLKMAVAAGSATAFREDLAKKEDVDRILKSL